MFIFHLLNWVQCFRFRFDQLNFIWRFLCTIIYFIPICLFQYILFQYILSQYVLFHYILYQYILFQSILFNINLSENSYLFQSILFQSILFSFAHLILPEDYSIPIHFIILLNRFRQTRYFFFFLITSLCLFQMVKFHILFVF